MYVCNTGVLIFRDNDLFDIEISGETWSNGKTRNTSIKKPTENVCNFKIGFNLRVFLPSSRSNFRFLIADIAHTSRDEEHPKGCFAGARSGSKCPRQAPAPSPPPSRSL